MFFRVKLIFFKKKYIKQIGFLKSINDVFKLKKKKKLNCSREGFFGLNFYPQFFSCENASPQDLL